MGQMIEVSRPDGGQTPAYLAQSPRPGSPAIVLIQEWWGLNGHIRSVADRLAAEGYTVLAPDLYRGRGATQADEAHHLMNSLDFLDATQQDIAGCVIHLGEGGRKVGITGFCMGGALTVAAAALEADMRAAGQSPEVHHYVAQHAFFNDSRTTEFFARHLAA